ncbi:hypothetical protein DQ04_02921020 [Trypanosoma grayi]|uniref:hypothetical protein n=1 Tax=Trypanosoma grayi TaxID=71804 RepID=UPI0004F4B8EC|nr:hypothetical protein DQ04_02921020 [Trypanosoma grayi]KEG11155.1 hypothetical protein DQ04_02921020 [Trypanosoma grayi]
MEDTGAIGQWSSGEQRPSEMHDTISKTSVPSATGSSLVLPAGTPTLKDTQQSQGDAAAQHAERGARPSKADKRSSKSTTKLPPIAGKRSSQRGSSTQAAGAAAPTRPSSMSRKSRKATGSRSSTPASMKKNARATSSVSRGSSRASSARKSVNRKGSTQPRKSRSASASRSRGGSRASSSSLRRKSTKVKGGSRPTSRKGSSRGKKGKKGKRRSVSPRASGKDDAICVMASSLAVAETVGREAIIGEEELARDVFLPDYHLLVMNIMRAQMTQVDQRQQYLNDTFKALQAHGVHLVAGQDPNMAVEMLRAQLQSEMRKETDQLRMEIASLRGLLDEKKTELEQKTAEAQGLRDKINRKLMRFEVECDSLKAEVQSALQTNQLDVDRMKRDLGHRLDVATASLRTPKYDTALRSMQDLVSSVQEEIQEHHDTLSKMIVSIGAQDTFLRDKSDSMHTNFPTRYRDELRKLDKDHLLNLLDVLSFHDTTVETVGKALYVLQKTKHNTDVF